MKLINSYWQQPIIVKAKMFLQLKSKLDAVLPAHLALQYDISQDANNNPVILVSNSVWLLQLKQHQDAIRQEIKKYFPKMHCLQWKIKPSFNSG